MSCHARSNLDMHFNPPTRKGWDATMLKMIVAMTHFNPPTRKGWDSTNTLFLSRVSYFNPPTRKGWDADGQLTPREG